YNINQPWVAIPHNSIIHFRYFGYISVKIIESRISDSKEVTVQRCSQRLRAKFRASKVLLYKRWYPCCSVELGLHHVFWNIRIFQELDRRKYSFFEELTNLI